MINRRKFIRQGIIGTVALGIKNETYGHPLSFSAKSSKPIVISTWDFGIAANQAAWQILKEGGRALDAVEAGVKVPEADLKNVTVGKGGYPDRDGHVTLDACIMDENGNCGAVLAMEHITHAISVARLVMEKTPHVMLAGDGALQFALENGFKKENLLTKESEKAWKEWLKKAEYKPIMNIENQHFSPNKLPGNQYNHDTIGMLALDNRGNLSGACTTSGMAFKMHGRVGDSPIIGAGLYVDNEIGAATSTGVGEEVVRTVGSFLVVELMRQGYSPEDACKEAVQRIVKKKPAKAKEIQVGFLAMNKQGEYGAYALQQGFSFAVCNEEQQDLLIKGKSIY
ncbi:MULTISPECIES: N(4)-(beta-N-acetylglucosaminyl)-L-asparaginase [Olivibacter]|uniref:N(4)-(Beta-N-acetylglucosaminyl)-L-asparaginase n=3 Tax=Sphingobacteriaceae TaxID=84566 RepID=F4C9D4_SPHS2|nr:MULTISPECIES: N(4)-(beta-N-acetylglucosaminyl)-L-asparaginase [Olivibacter]MCL4641157.1 N(4)-(beta-N-acetylglucosaminyl)-L-asparaginase [Olivibacter sp. UJ_SKK_5.1]MDM8175625.1 N(4)-(beta-N-acetylglucosaminyl)-L-asparaginase [Olivibacter sp. 47]MDX3914234.1 N(4)-(beta-N-acetylglucosaminyl)-L-asparaginase [Pseudosphingobacterium sp.]QEL02367.1 N(4)-(beta-N-acetylglucosaminyl)-L-asparaginase [Olivibacter sp. LS-1]